MEAIKEILLFGANPVIPISIGIVLYIWIAIGYSMSGKPWFGGMWLCYSAANLFVLIHTLVEQTK